PPPAGWVERATETRAGWRLEGWLLHPARGPFDELEVWWNGSPLGFAERVERPDLAESIYWLPRVGEAGFALLLPAGESAGRLDVLPVRGSRRTGRYSLEFVAASRETHPVPPAELTQRISGLDGDAFRLSGQKVFTDLWDQVTSTLGDTRSLRLLDWGCGCGRLTRYLARTECCELLGCDIDEQAVAWCDAHLPGTFEVTSAYPPLPYDEASLDVVFASSIFTHLQRADQERWLSELQRVIRPGGLLLASVMGTYAAMLGAPTRLRRLAAPGSILAVASAARRYAKFLSAGITDGDLDGRLDAIAPSRYYRSVMQTQAYTTSTWSAYFEVADYLPRGLQGHQDLVVLRRRP
ncbi:MAG TPA: class I SAM-dependent methyltransferase, partial [Solirubrobacteraceae bacterium]